MSRKRPKLKDFKIMNHDCELVLAPTENRVYRDHGSLVSESRKIGSNRYVTIHTKSGLYFPYQPFHSKPVQGRLDEAFQVIDCLAELFPWHEVERNEEGRWIIHDGKDISDKAEELRPKVSEILYGEFYQSL